MSTPTFLERASAMSLTRFVPSLIVRLAACLTCVLGATSVTATDSLAPEPAPPRVVSHVQAQSDAIYKAVTSSVIGVPINPVAGLYRDLQDRLAALDARTLPVAPYALAKAQCWLNASYHEETRNDRGEFTAGALAESGRITGALEQGTDSLARPTPLFGGQALRDDLWGRMNALHDAKGLACAARELACSEVELAESSHAVTEGGWRHANPYLKITEDRLAVAEHQAATCAVPQLTVSAPVVTPAPPAPARVPSPQLPSTLMLGADALFGFDRSALKDVLPRGQEQLAEFARLVNASGVGVQRLRVTGYTDRLGSAASNLALSLRRAQTVSAVLRAAGVEVPIEAVGLGQADQVVACGEGKQATPALVKCLQPNRRVQVEVFPAGK